MGRAEPQESDRGDQITARFMRQDFRKDNGRAIGEVCTRFVGLCRELGLLSPASVAIDGSKFKAVNNRDGNFSPATCSDTADRQEPSDGSRPRRPG
jgi:hypothetical protein